jgi:hypothetical protein
MRQLSKIQIFIRRVTANLKQNCSPKNRDELSLVSLMTAAAEPIELWLRLVSPSLVFFDLLELWNYGRIDMMPDAY